MRVTETLPLTLNDFRYRYIWFANFRYTIYVLTNGKHGGFNVEKAGDQR